MDSSMNEIIMELVRAFLVGGIICALVQVLLDRTKMMPGRVMVTLVVTGNILGWLGLYEPFLKWAGAGAGSGEGAAQEQECGCGEPPQTARCRRRGDAGGGEVGQETEWRAGIRSGGRGGLKGTGGGFGWKRRRIREKAARTERRRL